MRSLLVSLVLSASSTALAEGGFTAEPSFALRGGYWGGAAGVGTELGLGETGGWHSTASVLRGSRGDLESTVFEIRAHQDFLAGKLTSTQSVGWRYATQPNEDGKVFKDSSAFAAIDLGASSRWEGFFLSFDPLGVVLAPHPIKVVDDDEDAPPRELRQHGQFLTLRSTLSLGYAF